MTHDSREDPFPQASLTFELLYTGKLGAESFTLGTDRGRRRGLQRSLRHSPRRGPTSRPRSKIVIGDPENSPGIPNSS